MKLAVHTVWLNSSTVKVLNYRGSRSYLKKKKRKKKEKKRKATSSGHCFGVNRNHLWFSVFLKYKSQKDNKLTN